MQRLFGVVLLFLFAAVRVSGESAPRWLEVKSEHFTVLTNGSEGDAKRVAAQFERMRGVFHFLMPAASDDVGAPIMVLALKDRKSFKALEPEAYLGKNALDLAGYFQQTQDRNYVLLRLDAEGEHPYATVYHEYTHYMMRRSSEWMPLWLNEGLAEFYQNTDLGDEKDVRLGQPSVGDIYYLRQNKLLPLATLLAVDHESPYYHEEQKGSVFYAESWALTHYLEITDSQMKTRRLQDYSRLMQQHVDAVTAARTVFGDLKALQDTLDRYVAGSQFREFKLALPSTYTEGSFVVRPVTGPEADAVRAGVLLNVKRTKEAEDLLHSVLEADPKNALAHETMGLLRFREHDIAGAKKWYGEAVELDSKSYLSHYYFGVMSLESGERGDGVEKSLKAAIAMNPKFAPAYDALAHFYAMRQENLDEAHMMNLTAVQLEPENLMYRMNTANVLMQSQKVDAAISVMTTALKVAKTPAETQMIEGQLARMERFKKSMEEGHTQGDLRGGLVTTIDANGKKVSEVTEGAVEEVAYPDASAMGAHHTVSGVLRGVKCVYPTILTVTLEGTGKKIALYTNNYFKVAFTTANYEPKGELHPCEEIDGMKAKVEYGDVTDKRVVGQIVSIELSK